MSNHETHENHQMNGSRGEILVYLAEDGQLKVEVCPQSETV